MSEPSALSNLHYYQILGLRRTDVTQDEVKRAYKRLSLKFHPDRNRDDPNTTAKFQEISTAYNVLSSPRKRQIYDAYGEQGLKMYDSYMSFADSDDDSSKMPLQPVTMLLMVCVGISVLIFMSAAFGMLLLLYLSGSISPPLAVVFLPLWLVAAGGLCCLSVSLVGSRTNQTNLAVATLQLLCAVAFLILLCVRADSDQHLAYTCVVASTSPPALPSGPRKPCGGRRHTAAAFCTAFHPWQVGLLASLPPRGHEHSAGLRRAPLPLAYAAGLGPPF